MNGKSQHHEIGFIAQNVEKVLPEAVGEAPQAPDAPIKLAGGVSKSLAYERLIAPAILAIQQLKEMFDDDHGLLMKLEALFEIDHARLAADQSAFKLDHDEIATLKAANDNQAKAINDLREEFRTYKRSHP